jgi:hypothetical protein
MTEERCKWIRLSTDISMGQIQVGDLDLIDVGTDIIENSKNGIKKTDRLCLF